MSQSDIQDLDEQRGTESSSNEPGGLADAITLGDAIAVRSSWGAVASGTIDTVTDKPTDELAPGECLITISDPEMWDVSGGSPRSRHVEIDRGPPVGCRFDDWSGPGLSIGVGTDLHGFDFAGEVVLRQPEPVLRDDQIAHYYAPLPAGRVVDLALGPVVDPRVLLKDDDQLPEGVSR